MLNAVGFDLDNTLFDQRDHLRAVFREADAHHAAAWGIPPGGLFDALSAVLDEQGPRHDGIYDDGLRRLGRHAEDRVEALVAHHRAARPALAPFPGARAALDTLVARGLPLFIVTDGRGPVQRWKLHALGLAERFAKVVVTGDLAAPKPDPRGFEEACRAISVPPSRCAYVGDNPACDFAGANRLGMRTVRVRTGPFADDVAEGEATPRHEAATVSEVPRVLGLGD